MRTDRIVHHSEWPEGQVGQPLRLCERVLENELDFSFLRFLLFP